ncbi:type 1 glutamine amidotransferase [Falsirhodobacter algicola]|uniref:Type 1 glutamine amidotransferase n=1 Tax=Falsirhodobacter algicola TaxID=2692330 RepID=A0A8J8MQX4_9RHOB|nr:type 1 glutamine amidotransferase [Falsirhodobacter algicola]QUS35026.1 type 1 glutamine amidotransferase [Falsirhodobacter algicola]
MRIGILQTGDAPADLRPESGDYPDMFQRLLDGRGFTFRTWRVVDLEFPATVHEADGWLITGSRHGAYEDHAFIPPLEAFIRDIHAARVPLVGVCFGHQIIAQALGGRVEKFAGGWSVGPTDYRFGDETLTLNAWHQDQVVAPPPGARTVAQSDFCAHAALAYDDRAFTVQAHPEFPDAFIRGLIRTRGKGVVPDPLLAGAEARMGPPNSAGRLADHIADFFTAPRQA